MSTAIKERPVLFSGPMVRAILAGRKTQTRRAIKPQPPVHIDELHGFEFRKRAPYDIEHLETGAVVGYGFQSSEDDFCKCPYGRPGDRLWVRETWLPLDADHQIGDCKYAYQATTSSDGEDARKEFASCGRKYQWRPSIHMPRCASRLTLEIADLRVERLQDIDHRGCVAEGWPGCPEKRAWVDAMGDGDDECIEWFASLWEAINGPDSWDANPWVWIVEFKRLEASP